MPAIILGLKLGLLMAFILIVAACGGDEGTVTSAGGESAGSDGVADDVSTTRIEPGQLVESSWTLRSGRGPDGEVPLVDGWPITITFGAENLGGTAACNGYGGAYEIDGSELRLENLGQNDAGCGQQIQESERIYLAALQDVERIGLIDDELALTGPASELIFVANLPVPVDEVIDRLWLLESTEREGEVTPVVGEAATLLLSADGTLRGGTGCRSLTGSYIITGNEIQFTDFAAEGDCPTALRDQDGQVVTVLGDGFVPTVEGGVLALGSAGNEGLRYRAITEDELAAQSGTPLPSDAELLDGVEWIFAGGDGPDGPIGDPRTVDPEQSITFVLSVDAYRGAAVCNDYGGQAAVGDGRITLGIPEAEEEGCGDELDAIAAAFYDALPLMTEFGLERDGQRLVVNGNDTELWFERAG